MRHRLAGAGAPAGKVLGAIAAHSSAGDDDGGGGDAVIESRVAMPVTEPSGHRASASRGSRRHTAGSGTPHAAAVPPDYAGGEVLGAVR
jgi:hypothetical protein